MKKPSTLRSCLTALVVALTLGTSTVHAQIYCMPSYGTPCNAGGDYIQSFSTTGGTTNITNNNTGCNGSANNYVYYPAQTVTAAVGTPFNFSFTNSNTQQYYKIWIDWNNNLSFTDPGEEVYASNGNITAGTTITGSITVPTNASAGTKRMRIRSQFFSNPVTPCGSAMYGETEDYNVQVSTGFITCGGLALIDTAYVVNGIACASSNLTLSLYTYSASPVVGVQWQYASVGAPTLYTIIPGANTTPVTLPGMAGYYRAAVTCLSSSQTFLSAPVYVPQVPVCQDSVWPGDANYDLVANNFDFLAVTSSWGINGPVRSNASNAWTAQFGMDWLQNFANAINKKNADCNGDGTIDWADTVAISQNYGLAHLRPADEAPTEKTTGLPDLFVDLAGIPMTPGTAVTAPIRFGSAASPVTKIYGVAATVKMSGTATTGAPSVSMNPTWLGTPAQVLRFAKTTGTTTADLVASRITRRDTSGYGTLGTVTFSIPANATGRVKVSLQNIRVIDSTGAILTAYNTLADSANVVATSIGTITSGFASATVSPNPGTASTLQFQLAKPSVVRIQIVDAVGRKVWERSVRADASLQRIALPQGGLPAGVYTVTLRTDAATQPQQFRWVKQ